MIDEAVDLLAGRIVMTHAKDRNAGGRFVAAGACVVDFAGFLAALRRAGFDGPVVAHSLTAEAAAGVARLLRGCLGRAAP